MKHIKGKLTDSAVRLLNRALHNGRVTWVLFGVILLSIGPAAAQVPVPDLSHKLTPLIQPVEAAEFVLEDMDGQQHTFKDYRDKVVLINFWATWCPPCRREMPSLENLYQKLRNESFVVLAVNQWEDSDHVFAFMGQLDTFPSFPILFDPKSEVATAYGVKGLPTSFIIDKKGRVVFRAIGGREFDHPEIEQTIRKLLD